MNIFNPLAVHDKLNANLAKILSFNPSKDFTAWRNAVGGKLRELLGDEPDMVPPNIRVEYVRETELYKEIRYIFTSEAWCDVPCHLLIPGTRKTTFPVVICLQGHSTGMHISLGNPKYEGDDKTIAGERDFAIQAVKQGYAALVIEQRCFGERTDSKTNPESKDINRCHLASMGGLLIGRTMIGERAWDVSRAIDTLQMFPEIDMERIGCMGNSGGGTITFFASCMDERIKVSMPSCYVCNLADSLMSILHCTCNYIPGILKYFDIGDLSCLIAPRPLIVVAGEKDEIFPLHGVKSAFETIKRIYEAAGAPDRCTLVLGDGGHRFYAEQGWAAFKELSGWN